MSDDRMIRIDNFNQLKKLSGWTDKHIGELMKPQVSGAYVGKLLGGKTPFTEKTARRIEEAFGKPYKWLDEVHSNVDYSEDSLAEMRRVQASEQRAAYNVTPHPANPVITGGGHLAETAPGHLQWAAAVATNAQRAPVVAWARLESDLKRDNNEWPVEDQRPFFTKQNVSDSCKFVEIIDDLMASKFRRGDFALFDLKAEPTPGKTSLFLTPDGRMLTRLYEPLSNGGFEAVDEQGRAMDSAKHGLRYMGRFVLMQRDGE